MSIVVKHYSLFIVERWDISYILAGSVMIWDVQLLGIEANFTRLP